MCNNTVLTKKNTSGICISCKSKCPNKEQLKKDLTEFKTKVAIGKKYDVSDNAVKKWMKKFNL